MRVEREAVREQWWQQRPPREALPEVRGRGDVDVEFKHSTVRAKVDKDTRLISFHMGSPGPPTSPGAGSSRGAPRGRAR